MMMESISIGDVRWDNNRMRSSYNWMFSPSGSEIVQEAIRRPYFPNTLVII